MAFAAALKVQPQLDVLPALRGAERLSLRIAKLDARQADIARTRAIGSFFEGRARAAVEVRVESERVGLRAIEAQLAMIEDDAALAERFHGGGVVTDKEDRATGASH